MRRDQRGVRRPVRTRERLERLGRLVQDAGEDGLEDLDDPSCEIHTRSGRHGAARVLRGAEVDESLVSGGTRVAGTVRGSVLSPGVVVEEGARVVDSVFLPGVRVHVGGRLPEPEQGR